MRYQQQTITPDVAATMLAKNFRNRPINKKRVAVLVSDMRTGNWTESPNPICFDSSGNLIDGQHRLKAVIDSGCPVVMTVAYDVPNNAVIDKNLARSSGDSLYMRGIISKELSRQNVIALVNRYLSIKSGGCHPSDMEKGRFISEHSDAILKTIKISCGCRAATNICRRAGIQAAILGAILNGVSEDVLQRFAVIVNTGFMDSADESAAIILRNYVLSYKMTGASDADALAAYAQMAIKDFVDKNPRKRMYNQKKHLYIRNAEN